MKYDGASWCKQTAATEEGRHCSCSFSHWCACQLQTKGLLMKVHTVALGARGKGVVSDSTTNQTSPHHTVPYHASVYSDPSPTETAPFLACIVCLHTGFSQSLISAPDH